METSPTGTTEPRLLLTARTVRPARRSDRVVRLAAPAGRAPGFLQGAAALVGRRPDVADRLHGRVLWDVSDACRLVASEYAEATGPVVRFEGFVPDVLHSNRGGRGRGFVMLGAGQGMGQFVPQVFDYLGHNRQVLAVLPPGEARGILEELDWGVIADPDPVDIERALERLLELPPPTRPADPDGRYDREALAARLAAALDAAAVERQPGKSCPPHRGGPS